MKKLTPVIILCLCLLLSTPVYAAPVSSTITGYTYEGIYYEAVTLDSSSSWDPLSNVSNITVTKKFTFTGTVVPGDSIDWRETINGTAYIGTLYLYSYHHSEDTTIAIYKGTLYREDTSLR